MQHAPSEATAPRAGGNTSNSEQPYLRATEAAARYGIGRSTFWLYVKEGKLPQPICFGSRIRLWKVDELDQAFEKSSARPRAV